MSGGAFDYKHFQIQEIIEEIESELENQGKKRYNSEVYSWDTNTSYYPTYPKKVEKIMKDAIKYLKIAKIYAHRVDWYLSGDDGEDSLYKRLEEDLKKEKLKL